MQRRQFLQWASAAAIAPLGAHAKDTGSVTVLTSFPDNMVKRIEAAFNATHPDIKLQMLWRFGQDAFEYLHTPAAEVVDVYWAPARYNFFTLANEDRFAPVHLDARMLPGKIGVQQQSDPQSRYVAVETAAYVLTVNESYLAQRQLPVPQRFQDLADARYAGHIALPVPSRIGFAPPIYEHWLQSYGWQAGFELMSHAAAHATLIGSGGTGVAEKVGSGATGIGLSMDFFIHNAGAQGRSLSMVYPTDTLFSPAHLGILNSSRHPREARAFVDFMLSDAGQRLLLDPEIGRLPMRTSVYNTHYTGFNPYSLAKHAVPNDLALALRRQPVISALFDAAFTEQHDQLKTLWQVLDAASLNGASESAAVMQARSLITKTPITADQASDATLSTLLALPRTTASPERDQVQRDWTAFYQRNYAEALQLLERSVRT